MVVVRDRTISTLLFCIVTVGNILFCSPNEIKPFGPQMCRLHCGSIYGCKSYRYQPSQLSCFTESSGYHQDNTKDGWNIFHISMKEHLSDQISGAECEKDSRIITTHRDAKQCVQNYRRPTRKLPSWTRLLAVMYWETIRKVYQVNLQTGAVLPQKFYRLHIVLDILYLHFKKKLLVSALKPPRIIAISLKGEQPEEFYKTPAVAMAADEEREFLFIAIKNGIAKRFLRLTTEGDIDRYGPGIRNAYSIALDQKGNMVYAAAMTMLVSCTYDLGDLNTLDTGKLMKAVTIDPIGGNVIYGQHRDIMKRSLQGSNNKKVGTLYNRYAWKFIFYDEKVYIAYDAAYNRYGLGIWMNNYKRPRFLTKKIPKSKPKSWLICLIP